MKILVTGASGFIGGKIVERLRDSGHDIVTTGRGATSDSPPGVSYQQADLSDQRQCQGLLRHGIAIVIHCAGKADAWGSFASFERANVQVTKHLLSAARDANVGRFINLSSPSIYFAYRHQFNLKENFTPQKFSNAYAQTKYLAEKLVQEAHSSIMPTVSLRPRGVIGAGDRNWLPRIISMRQANRLIQPGHGENIVDFTSVANLVDVVETCLSAPAQSLGRTYNVTNGQPEKLWDVIESALGAVGLDGTRRHVPLALAMLMARLSERYHQARQTVQEPSLLPVKVGVAAYSMTLDISDAKNILGYNPRITTSEAIQEFASWWHKKLLY